MKRLIDKTITKLEVNDDQTWLRFTITDGVFEYEAWGECCSESWFQDIAGVEALLNATVVDVEEVPSYETDGTRQNYDLVYGIRFKTTRGYADIVYRNSSNGYYNGSCDLYDPNNKWGYDPDRDEPRKWQELTNDWSV